MADTAVQIAIQLLIPLITAEINLIASLPEDVKAIKDELESIFAFLESAEDKAVVDIEKKTWVKKVRTLAYDIEDVIEEYHLFLKEGTIGRTMNYITLRVRNMAATIKTIRQRAVDISRTRENYRFNNLDQHVYTETTSAQTVAIVPESELIGIKTSKREILQMLGLNNIVAVVGMRGLGKTAVVRSVYDDLRVRGDFDICVWISARRTRNSVEILKSMMKQFQEADNERNRLFFGVSSADRNYVNCIDSMDWNSLQHNVRNYMKNKRYLLVFDNVKDGYIEMANYARCLLKTDNKKSKILMTTRNEDVAHVWLDGSTKSLYKLRSLPYEKAWELFCRKTFQSNHKGRCPSFLQDLAKGIVHRCEGHPPAILALGRLLSTKLEDPQEWQKVHDSLGFYLENSRHLTAIYEIFNSNYNDLPYSLKPCFLYFGLFPKGNPINKMKLIRLWIAEGFIKNGRNNLSLEQIAEENLNKLISMSLVEVEHKDPSRRPKTLRIHDFLHEIILSKIHELSFCQILSKSYSNNDEKPRRLSIHKDHQPNACHHLKGIAKCKSSIRALVVFDPSKDISSMVLCTNFLKSVRLLKVLDLCNAPIDEIPSQLRKLRNLRYLSLRNTRVRSLPSYIGKMQDIQTLDLKQTQIRELPSEINELHKLRHLLTYSYQTDFSLSSHIQKTIGIKLPEGALGNFKELQKLAYVDMSHGTSLITDLKNLSLLRRLGITGLKWKDRKVLCSAIEGMAYLRSLNVYSVTKNEMIDLNHVRSPPLTLERLYLNGPLSSFPKWILQLHNIVKIRLRWSNIQDSESLENLHALPNLVELHLLEAYKGTFLEFGKKGFERLKILHLLDLLGLENLLIYEGALPSLEELRIGASPNLKVPSGIKHLRKLKTLNFYNMPWSFVDSIKTSKEHYSSVKHVPDVFFRVERGQGSWETYNLDDLTI